MKRIFILLLIATFSITGLHAQQMDAQAKQKNAEDLKVYQQRQEQDLQSTIQTQTQLYILEAAQRMETQKTEIQKDLEARRQQLMHRPEGMVPLSEEVRLRLGL